MYGGFALLDHSLLTLMNEISRLNFKNINAYGEFAQTAILASKRAINRDKKGRLQEQNLFT